MTGSSVLEVFAVERVGEITRLVAGSGDECIDGGSNVEDALYFKYGVRSSWYGLLSLSRGGKFDDAKQPGVGEAHILILDRVVTNACRPISLTTLARLVEILNPWTYSESSP